MKILWWPNNREVELILPSLFADFRQKLAKWQSSHRKSKRLVWAHVSVILLTTYFLSATLQSKINVKPSQRRFWQCHAKRASHGYWNYFGQPINEFMCNKTELIELTELMPCGYYFGLFWSDLGYIGQATIGFKVPNSSKVASIHHWRVSTWRFVYPIQSKE